MEDIVENVQIGASNSAVALGAHDAKEGKGTA
jgi:hypothetical protein